MAPLQIYILAIGANLCYSTASMVYSMFARRFSSMWVNQIKVVTAFVAFLLAAFATQSFKPISGVSAGTLMLSGFLGLCLGDIFLFRAFRTLGAGRSLVLYSFQPLLLGLSGFCVLGQLFSVYQTLAVICMIFCVFIFMLERSRSTGSWDVKSFFWAFAGIALDACGVMLSRTAFEMSPNLETFQVNVIRCMGALVGFLMISPKSYINVARDVAVMKRSDLLLLIGASIAGCFLSLTLYLAALKHAHVGTLTAIAITGPVWVSILECFYYRRLPNKYLLGAFAFFLAGFYLMVAA